MSKSLSATGKPKRFRTPSYSVFEKKFEPIEHEGTVTGNPLLLETFGPEMVKVQATDEKYVWTVVDGDNGRLYVTAGFRLVNRVNYILTKNPWVEGTEVFCYS